MRRAGVAAALWVLATVLADFLLMNFSLAATTKEKSTSTAQQQREARSEQRQLQNKLAQLKKQLAAAEASHSEAADALAESEAGISAANRKLRELSSARRVVETQLAQIAERSRQVRARQSETERDLTQLAQAQFAASRVQDWHRLIEAENPAQLARDRAYLQYLTRARASTLSALQTRREELAELESESRTKRRELEIIATDEHAHRATLLKQQAARKTTLTHLARRISEQRQSIASLERDEKRLSSLVDKLAKLAADEARRTAQRAVKAAPKTTPTPAAAPTPTTPSPVPAPTLNTELPGNTAFERLRGTLALPVDGTVAARFGSSRQVEGAGTAPTWKGVFIKAAEGAEVKSVAAGKVVFADWLRGFGNLIIVDHGEGFLSVYGNNESLLQQAGERVRAGQPIAEVGNTGGNTQPGLYFEMRFNGRPIDPLRWVAAR